MTRWTARSRTWGNQHDQLYQVQIFTLKHCTLQIQFNLPCYSRLVHIDCKSIFFFYFQSSTNKFNEFQLHYMIWSCRVLYKVCNFILVSCDGRDRRELFSFIIQFKNLKRDLILKIIDTVLFFWKVFCVLSCYLLNHETHQEFVRWRGLWARCNDEDKFSALKTLWISCLQWFTYYFSFLCTFSSNLSPSMVIECHFL